MRRRILRGYSFSLGLLLVVLVHQDQQKVLADLVQALVDQVLVRVDLALAQVDQVQVKEVQP